METLENLGGGGGGDDQPPASKDSPLATVHRRRLRPAGRITSDPSYGPPRDADTNSEEGKVCPFEHGDLVWAQTDAREPLWWPGKVIHPQHGGGGGGGGVFVRFYGDGDVDVEDQKPRRSVAQVKRFVEEFDHMAAQSKSMGFVAAVKEALSEVSNRLRSRLLCHCGGGHAARDSDWVADSRRRFSESGRLPFGDFSAGQLVEQLHGVARDVLDLDMLGVTVLVSWAAAIRCSRGVAESAGDVFVVDLMEDDDVLANGAQLDAAKDIVEGEWLATGGGVLGRPEVSDESNPRKERSIAEIIGRPGTGEGAVHAKRQKKDLGLGKMYVPSPSSSSSHCKRKKNAEVGMASDVGEVAVVAEEHVLGSGRRERKRSKYLSPPYTDMSGYGKRIPLPKDVEFSMPEKDLETPELVLTKLILDSACTQEVSQKEGITLIPDSVEKMFNELLCSAADHLHMKCNHSAKVVRKFFKNFRSSVYTEGSDFKDYQELADCKYSLEERSTKNEPRKDKSSRGKTTRKDNANGEKLDNQSKMATVTQEKGKYARKDKPTAEARTKLDSSFVNGQKEAESGHKKRSYVDDADQTRIDPKDEVVDPFKECTTSRKTNRSSSRANGTAPVLEGHKLGVHHESSSLKKRQGKDSVNGETVMNSSQKHANGSEEARLALKKKKDVTEVVGDTYPLLLTFTPGSPMPCKDALLSTFSKYGAVIASKTEMLIDSHSARVVFAKAVDAKKAVKSLEGLLISGASVANCELQMSSGKIGPKTPKLATSKSPLPYIKKSLEKMISKLVESPAPEKDGTKQTEQLRPDLAVDLANEMKGVLQKVKKLLSEPSASTVI